MSVGIVVGLALVLGLLPDVELLGVAESGEEAIELVARDPALSPPTQSKQPHHPLDRSMARHPATSETGKR